MLFGSKVKIPEPADSLILAHYRLIRIEFDSGEYISLRLYGDENLTKTQGNVDELNRGYVDDMSELKQYGGKAMVDSWSKPFYDTLVSPRACSYMRLLALMLDSWLNTFGLPEVA
ncbi:Cysteine--tRNA ligase [Gossypium arboreum]|uniref:Cysteine--tRNA ligase n=1 Tax=Gossypium arboreum TaxID=29729 RepID=A0A0B0PD10_GOSAR|nr:Cysteine--tRNA ligase [Gossypium arboreum]